MLQCLQSSLSHAMAQGGLFWNDWLFSISFSSANFELSG